MERRLGRKSSWIALFVSWPCLALAQPSPPPGEPAEPTRTPEVEGLNSRAFEAYRDGRHEEALKLYVQLARINPRLEGVLATIGATLVPHDIPREQADAMVADAEAHPEDPLLQYMAGLLCHYHAYSGTSDREEKRRYYELTRRYLERALPAYDFATRVYIYLAVSHFRLGEPVKARAAIDRAIELGQHTDPDVFYCRAEILRHDEPAQAIEDLGRYITLMEESQRRGARVRASKERSVRRTHRKLIAVRDGQLALARPYDPMAPWGELPALLPGEALQISGGALAAVALLAVLLGRRRTYRAGVSQGG